jgi:hypothetical protein
MPRLAWKQLSVAAILILVTFIAASNAYAASPTQLTNTNVFVAADLTLTPSGPSNLPSEMTSEIFVVLEAGGPTNHLVGALFLFTPVSSCSVNVPGVVPVSGTLFTNPTTGIQTLSFTGYLPPDPCIHDPGPLGRALVKIMIGPAPTPPDPCILTLQVPGVTVTFTGETTRFVVATVTSTTTTTTPPP